MQIPLGADGSLLIGKWVSMVKSVLECRPEAWRRTWLELHEFEMEEVRKARREWADKLQSIAIAPDLTPEASTTLLAETLAVLRLPGLEPLFAPGSRAEQPICGIIGEESFAGQIDRLAVTDEAVLFVDYKTTRQPPPDVSSAPVAYLRQLAAYGDLVARELADAQ